LVDSGSEIIYKISKNNGEFLRYLIRESLVTGGIVQKGGRVVVDV